MKSLFLPIVILFVFISCKQTGDTKSRAIKYPLTIRLNLSEATTDPIDLSLLADKVEYIPLQTTDSSMLGYIYRFCITKDYYLLNDEGCIFIFDNKGRYVKRLFQTGRGPGETSTRNFTVDENGETVYVLDNYNGNVKVYNISGAFVKEINSSAFSQKVYSIGYYNNKLILTTAQFPKMKLLYSLFDLSDNSIHELYNNHYAYKESQLNVRPQLIFWIDRTYQVLESDLLFKEWLSDTIFTVNANLKTEPKYIVDLSGDKLDWLTWRDNGMFNILKQGPPSGYWVQSFVETDSFLFLSLKSFKDQSLFAIFDKRSGSVKILANKHYEPRINNQVYLRNDIDSITDFPAIDKGGNIFFYDNCLFSIIEAKDFLNTNRSASEKTILSTDLSGLSGLTEFGNPVIMKVYIR